MRSNFDKQLVILRKELTYMGALCETAIASAAKALDCSGEEFAKINKIADDDIDRKERDIEEMCIKLLLSQQPVASDLRQISAALKMITDMERIGDQSSDILEIVKTDKLCMNTNTTHLKDMARETITMVTLSIDAFVKQDMQLAEQVIGMDDAVDTLFDTVKHELLDMAKNGTGNGEVLLDTLMIAKYFERIGDHATNIAEWVVYSITGEHKSFVNGQ